MVILTFLAVNKFNYLGIIELINVAFRLVNSLVIEEIKQMDRLKLIILKKSK
jgi:hypothetical protein